ncbi:MAG: glycoside hydrolase domain-containing protein [Armatimonadia bacterium]
MTRHILLLSLILTSFCSAQTFNSFETPQELKAFSAGGLEATQVKEHATDGQYSLLVKVKGSTTDSWPGLAFTPPNPDLSGVAILAFDVFNPGSGPVSMSCRIDDAGGKSVFLSSNINPGKSTVELWLTSHRYDLDMKKITKIYPYFRMPRKDITLYLDNFRFTAMAAKFKSIVHQETAPAIQPTDAENQRGYLVFARHWLESVFPNTTPLPGEADPKLSVFGCPGQTVPVALCVRGLQDLGQTTLVPADLKSAKAALPASAIKPYPVSYRDKRWVYASDYYIKDMPTILEERASVAVPAGRTQLYWLNVTIPAGTAAGVYSGTVTVKAEKGQASEVPLQVRVLPYTLIEPKHMLWGEYYTRPSFAKTLEDERRVMERDLRDQRAHGMTSVGLCFGLDDAEWKLDGTKVTVSPVAGSRYETFMNLYRDLKFPMPSIQLSDTGQTVAGKHAFGSPEYIETYKAFWVEMARVHKERGWPEIIVQPVDEPSWQGPDERSRNLACLKWLKEIPGQRTEIDGPVDGYFLNEVGPYADVWNGNGAVPEAKKLAEAKAQGRIIVSYNNDVESYRPEMGRYCNGFFQLRAGTRGTYNWAYISYAGNPYDDQDAETGSWMHWYPPMPEIGEVGGPSTGWEGARAGVDDFKYVYTLQRAIQRAQASRSVAAKRAAKQGQAALAAISKSIRYNPQTRGTAAFTSEKSGPDGSKIAYGPLKVPNGWDFDTYDRVRWQIASATMKIMEALRETPATPRAKTPPAVTGKELIQDLRWSDRAADTTAGAMAAQKQVGIPMVQSAPACDGDLSDAVWQKAAKIPGFTRIDGSGPADQQTHVWLCTDGKSLYVAAECLEENITNITARVAQDGGPVWGDDCLELFFDPGPTRSTFRQIVINTLGKVFWSNPQDKSWRPALERGAKVDVPGRRWFVEMGIPLTSLDLTSNVFGFNICRERRPLESLELSCWSPTGSGFGVPGRFGIATIGGSYLQDFRLGRGVVGVNELTATVRNDSAETKNFVVILDWKQGKKVALYRQKGPFALEPGKSEQVTLPYEIATDQAPATMKLVVRDANTNASYAERHMEQQVLPALKMTLKPVLYYLNDAAGQLHLDLNLDEALSERAVVVFSLLQGTHALRRQVLSADAERLDATLNTAGLPAGAYTIEAALKTGPDATARRLGTQRITMNKVAGPFD